MKRIIFALALLGSSPFAHAVGDAGCGLGSVVISKNSKLLQLFAMTTNATFFSQTFGITFGTSNCSASGLVLNEKQIQYFVEANQDDIVREMAQGHGDKLSTLAALHGCSTDSSVNNFNEMAQKSFEQIVPAANTNAVDLVRNMEALSLRNACLDSPT